MENVLIIGILLCIVGAIVFYLYRVKKQGETCIGCPYARQCAGKRKGCKENEEEDDGKYDSYHYDHCIGCSCRSFGGETFKKKKRLLWRQQL